MGNPTHYRGWALTYEEEDGRVKRVRATKEGRGEFATLRMLGAQSQTTGWQIESLYSDIDYDEEQMALNIEDRDMVYPAGGCTPYRYGTKGEGHATI